MSFSPFLTFPERPHALHVRLLSWKRYCRVLRAVDCLSVSAWEGVLEDGVLRCELAKSLASVLVVILGLNILVVPFRLAPFHDIRLLSAWERPLAFTTRVAKALRLRRRYSAVTRSVMGDCVHSN